MRNRRLGIVAVLVALLMLAGAALVTRDAGSAPGELAAFMPPATFGPPEGGTLVAMPADTPPPLEQRTGWPFEALPMVAKYEWPEPRVALVVAPPPSLFADAPVRRIPLLDRPSPQVADRAGLILLPLGAAALAVGSTSGSVGADGPPTAVPEPSTLLLLISGLGLLVGYAAISRRRREDFRGDV